MHPASDCSSVHLYLVRHGQTQWNEERRLQGQLDSPLTELGKQQARLVGTRLANLGVARIVGSDLGRTRQTASTMAEVLNCSPYEEDVAYRERNLGVLQGCCATDLTPEQAAQYESCRFGDPAYAPPQGESRLALAERGVVALQRLAQSHVAAAPIAVVSHGGLLGAALGHLLGVPPSVRRSFYVANCSLHHVVWRAGNFEVVTLGEVSHL